MSLKVELQERETSRKLVRRFCQAVRRSGILRKARASRFKQRPESETKRKKKALRKEEMKKKFKELGKLGR